MLRNSNKTILERSELQSRSHSAPAPAKMCRSAPLPLRSESQVHSELTFNVALHDDCKHSNRSLTIDCHKIGALHMCFELLTHTSGSSQCLVQFPDENAIERTSKIKVTGPFLNLLLLLIWFPDQIWMRLNAERLSQAWFNPESPLADMPNICEPQPETICYDRHIRQSHYSLTAHISIVIDHSPSNSCWRRSSSDVAPDANSIAIRNGRPRPALRIPEHKLIHIQLHSYSFTYHPTLHFRYTSLRPQTKIIIAFNARIRFAFNIIGRKKTPIHKKKS